ncbi:MAG: RimK family alpha-L-glutamate ligase [Patescibacteria group bacterium]
MEPLNIGVLMATNSKNSAYTNIERLEQAGLERGYKIIRICEPLLYFSYDGKNLKISHDGEPLFKLEVIINRPNFICEPGLHAHTINLLKTLGVYILNGNHRAVSVAKNKLLQHHKFIEKNIPSPKWAMVNDPKIASIAALNLGFPVIIKVAFGTHGIGTFFANSLETFMPLVDYLNVRDKNPIIIEEFIAEADKKDVRVYLIGGKIVAAMERTSREHDIRSNAALGGNGGLVELTKEETELAIKTAEAFELDVIGIDILRSKRGPLVIEVNANPGFEVLEQVTGRDVAGAMIDEAIKHI